jgi:3-oxoacyl-[acyl-carrier protein] reductase
MSDLKGKVAIVTGASKGIGAGIAKGFAAAGAAVVVNYLSSREGADRVVGEITKKGGKAIAVQGDVARSSTCSGCSQRRQKRSARLISSSTMPVFIL